jgi:hypothetical protein
MKISTKLHTVFILVGPSMCGKSTFALEFQRALQRQFIVSGIGSSAKVEVISSDNERRNLIANGEQAHRYSPVMAESSEAAFNVLIAKFKASIMFPVNSEFVIIDTTGMNDTFRKEIKKIANDQEYRTELVTFEYANYQYWSESNADEKRIVELSAKRFKQSVLPNLGRKDHDGGIRIRERSPLKWMDVTVEIENLDLYAKSHVYLTYDQRLNVIGDSHEHVLGLTTMLEELKAADDKAINVLDGDYLDKGNNTEEMLRVISKFVDDGGILIHGNHESYAVKRIKGLIKNPDLVLEEKYMTSLSVLLKRPDLAAVLVDLFDNHSVPFLKVTGNCVRTIYVTHAPCKNKYLGKMNGDALKAQRNLYGSRDEDYRLAYKFIFEEAVGNHPIHIFGHVAHNADKIEFRNKIFLDTGAAYGNKLTAFVFQHNRYDLKSVKTESVVSRQKELQNFLTTPMQAPEKRFSIYDYKLSPDDYKFLNRTLKNGVQYISGTMAPAHSTDTEIESLEAGLNYFRKSGVSIVLLQPKYMGSRCQAYLYRGNLEKCFLVSRNGFKIRMTEDLTEMLAELLAYQEANRGDWDELILDGELLPWTTLGLGLVDEQFKAYEGLVRYELSTLAADEEFNKLVFKQKIDAQSLLDVDLKIFSDTLDLYAGTGKPYYKAFAVLKDDSVVWTRSEVADSFPSVNTDETELINFAEEGWLEKAKTFFDKKTVAEGMEGIVIKPFDGPVDVAPYMKVRNENYLTLVYGYDYKHRYEPLCRQKRVGGKLKVSIKEFELATQLLSAETEQQCTEIIVKMIAQLNQEKELDPRL